MMSVQSKRSVANDEPSIQKIGKNACISYGDGGSANMKWEIYVSHDIERTMNMELVSRLKEELIALGKERDDWREGAPIQNIIDPDLYVLKIYEKDRYWLSAKHKQQFMDDQGCCDEEAELRWKTMCQNDERGYWIRRRYQWLATQFVENGDGHIHIVSPIHNVSPRSEFEGMHNGIEHVFEKMLPLFNRFPVFQQRQSNEFQVIVKAQRYEVEDMSGYNGHWHQEGLTENIIIGGLYYFEKDTDLKGGNLRFRNKVGPHPFYESDAFDDDEEWKDEQQVTLVHEAEIGQGTALVFDNVQLVHRVRMLKNKLGDQQKRYRSFLAFFIVDPEKPIKSTRDHPSLKQEIFIELIIKHSAIDVVALAVLICEYAPCGYTLSEAKKVRELNIECRKNPSTKGKWAQCMFGNSGDRIWFGNGKKCSDGTGGCNPEEMDSEFWVTTTESSTDFN